MLVGFIILAITLILGFPIYLAILSSSMYILLIKLEMDISSISLILHDGVGKFTLMAVPFFLLSGAILDSTSLAKRLVDWLFSMVASIRGGVPLSGVIANEFFGAVSGSSAAATGTIGKILYPEISKIRTESFALGLLTSAGGLAIIMPPSITLILYGATASISVGTLFLTGIIPALIIGCILGIYIIVTSEKKTTDEKFSFKDFILKSKNAIWIIILPIVVLGGIYGGIFTPTEAGAVAGIYAFAVAVLIYKEMGLKSLREAVSVTITLTAQIFIIIGSSAVFSQAMTLEQVPQQIVGLMSDLSTWQFLLILNIFLLLVGMFFDPTSAVLVLTPLLIPVAQTMGVDLYHLGMVITVNLAIGTFTPPFGLNLFVAQGVFNQSIGNIVNGLKQFWVWYFLALLIITYLPQLYMWIPNN